jgi:hypothetical protein
VCRARRHQNGKGQGQTEKERKLEDQNKEPISKNPPNTYNNK